MKHASLKKRLLAYVIDMFIVGLIVSIISLGNNTSKLESLNKELYSVNNSYVNREISDSEYIKLVSNINYDMGMVNVTYNTLYAIICIGYFIMFQYLNDGASIGKKLMGIRIINNDNKRISLFKLIIRTSIIDDIIPALFLVIMLYLTRGVMYMVLCGLINIIRLIYMLASVIMINKREDNLSLNDIMSNSVVIGCK